MARHATGASLPHFIALSGHAATVHLVCSFFVAQARRAVSVSRSGPLHAAHEVASRILRGVHFPLDDEADLEPEAAGILARLREMLAELDSGANRVVTSAQLEGDGRHLRLRMATDEEERWIELLVGDGYTEVHWPLPSILGYLSPPTVERLVRASFTSEILLRRRLRLGRETAVELHVAGRACEWEWLHTNAGLGALLRLLPLPERVDSHRFRLLPR